MRLFPKKHLRKDQKTMKNQNPMYKSNAEYVVNQAIIWIAIVFIAVVIIKNVL